MVGVVLKLSQYIPIELGRVLDDAWETLLTALLDLIPAIVTFYEDRIVQDHSDRFNVSSLGILFQRLWREYQVESRRRLTTFLRCDPSIPIRYKAAEISMRLLMCR
jgi:hypothetical protein